SSSLMSSRTLGRSSTRRASATAASSSLAASSTRCPRAPTPTSCAASCRASRTIRRLPSSRAAVARWRPVRVSFSWSDISPRIPTRRSRFLFLTWRCSSTSGVVSARRTSMRPSWRAAVSDSPSPSLWGAFQRRWGITSSRRNPSSHRTGVKKNIALLYGFSFFDQFMIVIALWVPYLATKGIGMRQFMELQAVFALVILCGEVPSGLLSDLWGRKRTLLLGSTLKAISFSLLPLWTTYEGFLIYHLTMGIALSMISGGDVALLYDSHLAAGGEKSRGTAVLGNANLAAQAGGTVSALLGGAVVTLSY